MANYYGVGRSNYFQVKDVKVLEDFCEKYDLELIKDAVDNEYAFISNNETGEIRYFDEDDHDYSIEEILTELSTNLVEGWVAVFITVGNQKHNFLGGWLAAVDSTGKVVEDGLFNSFTNLSKEFPGQKITAPEH